MSAPRYPAPTAPHVVIAVDPALHASGVAVLTPDGDVLAATTIRPSATTPARMARAIYAWATKSTPAPTAGAPASTWPTAVWVWEQPQLYATRRAVRGVEALEDVLGALVQLTGPPAATWHPGAWKGNVPKPVHHRRIAKHLPPWTAELGHDALDALALGLFAVGKVGRGGVRAPP